MATVFSTTFTDHYETWTSTIMGCVPSNFPKLHWGCNGGYAAAPCSAEGWVQQPWASGAGHTAVTARCKMAFATSGIPLATERLIFDITNGDVLTQPPCTFRGGGFSATISMDLSGRVRLVIFDTFGTRIVDTTSAVVETFSGIYHGYQFSIHITSAATADYNVVRDNVSLLSGTATCFPGAEWDPAEVTCIETGANFVNGFHSVIAEVVIDDTVNITSYTGCSQEFPISLDACNPTHTFTNLDFNCSGNTLILTGTQLLPYNTLIVYDPFNVSVPYTIISASMTEIILEVDGGLIGGQYCILMI